MIHIDSQATRGVQVPNLKQMRGNIIGIFKIQTNRLKKRLRSISTWSDLLRSARASHPSFNHHLITAHLITFSRLITA